MIVVYVILGLFVLFFLYIGTRKGKFSYQVTEKFEAPASVIFPYLRDLTLGSQWSPFEKVDPNLKREYIGPSNQVGGKLVFQGNREAGSGSIEILKIEENKIVELRLIMTAPFPADNIVRYELKEEVDGTLLSWTMSGDGGYLGKFLTFFVDCEKLVTDQFRAGLVNLKNLIEEAK